MDAITVNYSHVGFKTSLHLKIFPLKNPSTEVDALLKQGKSN